MRRAYLALAAFALLATAPAMAEDTTVPTSDQPVAFDAGPPVLTGQTHEFNFQATQLRVDVEFLFYPGAATVTACEVQEVASIAPPSTRFHVTTAPHVVNMRQRTLLRTALDYPLRT